MDELASIFNNVARLVAIVGGGISTVALCYADIMWMTASGDPQKMGQARMALMGAIGGLVIVGIAFIVPRIVSQAVIEPVGGVALGGEAGADCDQVLKNQLVFQRGASTAANMNVVIAQLQAQRDECTSETWNPVVNDAGYIPGTGTPVLSGLLRHCGWFQGDGYRDSGGWGHPGAPFPS